MPSFSIRLSRTGIYLGEGFFLKPRAQEASVMDFHQVEMISPESPAQFEARTGGDRPVYVRYRHGCLSVEVGLPGQSGGGLPGDGYVVYEERLELASGNQNAITWDEVRARVAAVDLRGRLDRLEEQERAYRARWEEIFEDIRKQELPNVVFWTLRLAGVPWATPSENRVGRFDFESAMKDRCREGVCAYAFDDPELGGSTITVLPTAESAGRWDPMELALAGAEAFGGVRFGPTGGAGRGEARGRRAGDAGDAFSRVAARLAGSVPR